MTKPTQRIPAGELLAAIDDFIKVHSRTTAELVKLTRYSDCSVRKRLVVLEERGIIHKIAERCDNGMGLTFHWHAGPVPSKSETSKHVSKPILGETPRRFFLTTYPAVGRRDALVAALFGPAKQPGLLTGILNAEP